MATSNVKNNNHSFQIFVLNCILFILFGGYLLLSIYPQISEIEEKKVELKSLSEKIKDIETKGLTYEDFNSLKSTIGDNNSYLSNLMKNITESFYNRSIRNNGQGAYNDFYTSKLNFIADQKNENVTQKRNEIINSLLPQYSSTDFLLEGDKLTDFKFVNYVESLLYAFNLNTDNAIGITEIKPVDDYSTNLNAKSVKKDFESIDSNIFYIPLSLTISGKKEGLIDFFKYIQNVGVISIENSDLKVFSGGDLLKKIPGPSQSNIYQNQIFDIESILMKEYIDSDTAQVDGDFVDFVKKSQGTEDIQVEMVLRFYIKGLPNYKIKEFIKNTIKKYDDLNKIVTQKLKQVNSIEGESGEILIIVNRFRTMGLDLTNMQKGISGMNAALAKAATLDEVYKSAINYNDKLLQIEKSIADDSDKLDILKTNK